MQTQLILWLLCFSFTRKIAIFKETIQTERVRVRKEDIKLAHSNFNQWGRPWGWLTKWWWKKQPHCSRSMSVCSHHDTTRERLGRLYGDAVWWTCSAPTESHSGKDRWMCPRQSHIYCCNENTSKWSQGLTRLQSLLEDNLVTIGQGNSNKCLCIGSTMWS